MSKQKRGVGVSSAFQATQPFGFGTQDPAYSTWLASLRRIIVKFFAEHRNALHELPEHESKAPLTVTEQLQLLEQLQRVGSGTGNLRYGSYPQEPVRFRPNVDHLVHRTREKPKDADLRGLDPSTDQSDDEPT
jgi:hypothetical protein